MMHHIIPPGARKALSPGDSFRIPATGVQVHDALRGHYLLVMVDCVSSLPATSVQQNASGALRLFWKGQLKYTFKPGYWGQAVLDGKPDCP
jgi:hypothetical protein